MFCPDAKTKIAPRRRREGLEEGRRRRPPPLLKGSSTAATTATGNPPGRQQFNKAETDELEEREAVLQCGGAAAAYLQIL